MTSGKVHFSEHVKSNYCSVFSANQSVRLDSEHVQSEGKSVNCKLPVLDLPRGHDSSKQVWPLGMREKEGSLEWAE